jgi:hypothetical protein
MWKVRDKVVWEVRSLIIGRRTKSQWCNIGSTRVGNSLLVRVPIFAEHKSSNVSNLTPGIVAKGIEVFRLLLLCHDEDGDDEDPALMTGFL